MSGSRNIKTCKTRGRRGGSVVGERAPDILLCCARRASPAARARDPCGTHAQWRLLCYGFLHMACRHAARLRSCAPFAWRCGTGACTRDLHHPPSCAVQYVATRRRSALHVHNSDGTRDGMPSRFLTADHCVSHHMLHSACVMRMCCGVGLSMWQVYLTTPPTSTHGLSRVQHLLRATTTSSTARLASRARELHRALRGKGLLPGTPDLYGHHGSPARVVWSRARTAFCR